MVSLKKVHVRRQRKLAEVLTNNHDHAPRLTSLSKNPLMNCPLLATGSAEYTNSVSASVAIATINESARRRSSVSQPTMKLPIKNAPRVAPKATATAVSDTISAELDLL